MARAPYQMPEQNKNYLASIEVVPPAPHSSFEVSKNKLLAKAGAILGGIALALSAGSTAETQPAQAASDRSAYAPPLEYVGFSTNEIFVENKQAAEEAAQRIEDSGANSVRIFMPYTKGGAEIDNDKLELCNAARAAYDHNLKLIISFNGYSEVKKKNKKSLELGYVPESPSEIRKFTTALGTIMWNLAKDPEADGTNGGCVPEQKRIVFEPFNEVNSTTFNRKQDAKTAERYMRLLSKVTPAIKNEAKKDGLSVDVTIIGGALAASHDPVGFAQEMGRAMKDLKIDSVPFDVLSVHPYAPSPDASPVPTQQYLYSKLKPVIDKYFPHTPLMWNEAGVNGQPPAAKRGLYDKKSLADPAVSEAKQAQYYEDFYATAACQKDVIGGMTFQLTDDGKKWSSGIHYPDRTPKSSAPLLTNTQSAAVDGTLTTCP